MPADDGTDNYTGNGSTTAFTYNFKLLDQAHIKVLVDGATKSLGTHYTVSGVGVSTGGTVTFVTAPANAAKVVLVRNASLAQLTNYVANSAYNATRVMSDLDKLVALTQQLQEQLSRAYKVLEGYSQAALPNVCPGTQKMVGFDATGAINCAADLNAAAATANQWDQITAPIGNAAFSHGNNRTTFTYGTGTGANPAYTITDTTGNTGTGALFQVNTTGTSTAKVGKFTAGGTANGVEISNAGALAKIGTGDIKASSLETSVNVFGVANNSSATAAFNALDPLTTKGDLLAHNGTDSIRFAVCGNDIGAVADSTQASGWKCNTTGPIERLIVKTADEIVNTSTTFQDDDHLVFACTANTSYGIEAQLLLNATSTTPDFKFQWTGPSGFTMFWGPLGPTAAGTGTTSSFWYGTEIGAGLVALLTGTGTHANASLSGTAGMTLKGIVRCAGTAGNVQLQWAQNTSTAADSKLLKDSWMKVTKLN